MTKKEANKWLKKIYGQLFRPMVRFRLVKLKGLAGEVYRHDDGMVEVRVDPYNPEPFISTIIHECIHLCDSGLSEKEVLNLENKIFNTISERQMQNLLKKIVFLV